MKHYQSIILASAIAIGATQLTGCGYNALQMENQQVNAAWAEVVNQYQRRTDLVPNLVNTVKGYANHEDKVLNEVTTARANVGSIRITPETVNDPKQLQKYIDAQNQLQGSLSRLISVSENYPDLKANQNFQDLAAQLEGTENRIAVSRGRYIESIQQYNTHVYSFPTNITAKIFGLKERPQFTVANEQAISSAPTVSFDGNNGSSGNSNNGSNSSSSSGSK